MAKDGTVTVLIPLFRSFILIQYLLRDCFPVAYNCLNPFVQVFYSNKAPLATLLVTFIGGLNPFVQVFYSNMGFNFNKLTVGDICLNPFVQVFYSNVNAAKTIQAVIQKVLIPLFRSFILIIRMMHTYH